MCGPEQAFPRICYLGFGYYECELLLNKIWRAWFLLLYEYQGLGGKELSAAINELIYQAGDFHVEYITRPEREKTKLRPRERAN